MEHEIAEMERRRYEAMSRASEIPRLTRISLGDIAAGECERHHIEHIAVCHPSRRGHTNEKMRARSPTR
jgi:hypothetical protein